MTQDPQAPAGDAHAVQQTPKQRNAAANAVLVVGFLLLVFVGIAIAIYSARYIPLAVNSFSSTNPVTGLPNQNAYPAASAVTTPGTSIPFNSQPVATTTAMVASNDTLPQATNVSNTSQSNAVSTSFPTTGPMYSTLPNGYQNTASAYNATQPVEQPTTYNTQPYESAPSYSSGYSYSLPDLATNIVAVGYLANSSNSSFVATPVVPIGARAAVQFTIGNRGTAPTGPWAFVAEIPTDNGYIFHSPVEASMNPGDHVLFTLAFDQVPEGPAEMINIIADPQNYIQELSKSNNEASASVSVVGS